MSKNHKIKYRIIWEGKSILSFFLTPSKDGVIFGFIIPNHDIHLSILYNGEKGLIQPHITDKNVTIGRRQQPIGRYTDILLIMEEIIYRVKSWIRIYHYNQRGWILKPKIKSQIQDLIMPKELSNNIFNQPFYTEIELPDFSNDDCWTRVRLRNMIGIPEMIFLESKIILRLAFILDEKRMILVSERQLEEIIEYLFDVIGLNDYIKYIKRKVPKRKFINM